MLRNTLAVFLAFLLVLPLHGYQQKPPTIQEQITKIRKGRVVEIKLKDKKKVKGRLGEVSAEDFEVQVTQDQKVDNVRVRYADVNSVQEKRVGNRVASIAITSAAVYVLVALTVGVVLAAVGFSR